MNVRHHLPMRRGAALLALLALVLVLGLPLAACSKGDDSGSGSSSGSSVSSSDGSSASGGSSVSVAASSSVPGDVSGTQSGSDPASGSVSAAPAAPAVSLRTDAPYFCRLERFREGREPYIQFEKGERFVFRFNSGEGLCEARGSYTAAGGTLTLHIEKEDLTLENFELEDFSGSDQMELTFTLQDEYRFSYSGGAFGLTHSGDLFEQEGAPKPKPASSSAPVSSPSDASGASDASSASSAASFAASSKAK